MKTAVMIAFSVLIALVVCRTASADGCRSDLDCAMDQRCVVPAYESIGSCVKVGDSLPKNSKPASPGPSGPSSASKHGKFCMSNTDCDPGQSCTKKGNDLSGTCR